MSELGEPPQRSEALAGAAVSGDEKAGAKPAGGGAERRAGAIEAGGQAARQPLAELVEALAPGREQSGALGPVAKRDFEPLGGALVGAAGAARGARAELG